MWRAERLTETLATDNGDDMWDADTTPPELLPEVFSSRKKKQMKKKPMKRRATKGTREPPRGNLTYCHGFIFICSFFRICPQQEAEANPLRQPENMLLLSPSEQKRNPVLRTQLCLRSGANRIRLAQAPGVSIMLLRRTTTISSR